MTPSVFSFVPFVGTGLASILSALARVRRVQAGSDIFMLRSTDPGELSSLANALQAASTLDAPTSAATAGLLTDADFIRYLRVETATVHKLYMTRSAWRSAMLALDALVDDTQLGPALALLRQASATDGSLSGDVVCISADSSAALADLWDRLKSVDAVRDAQCIEIHEALAQPPLTAVALLQSIAGAAASAGVSDNVVMLDPVIAEEDRFLANGILVRRHASSTDLILSRSLWGCFAGAFADSFVLSNVSELAGAVGIVRLSGSTDDIDALIADLVRSNLAQASQFVEVDSSLADPSSAADFAALVESLAPAAFPAPGTQSLYLSGATASLLASAATRSALETGAAWLLDATDKLLLVQALTQSSTADAAGWIGFFVPADQVAPWRTWLSNDPLLKNAFLDGRSLRKEATDGTLNDSYKFGRGGGADWIVESGGTADELDFSLTGGTAGRIDFNQLWFSHEQGSTSLTITVMGTGDRITIADWYADDAHKVESIVAAADADGTSRTLYSTDVDLLVDAMAAMAPPTGATSWTALTPQQQSQLQGLGVWR